MADIAQLGIAVDTSQTKLAARELDNLAAAGAKAEGSTKKLGSTSKQAMEQAAAATAKAQQTMERMLAAQERQEKLMEQMAREMQQLTQALQGNASANNAAAHAAQNAAQAMGQQSRAAKDAQGAIEGASKASGGSAKSMNDAERAAVAMGAGLARAVAVAGALAAAVGVLMVSVAKSATEIERFALMADAMPEQLQRMAAGAKTAGMGLENYASTIKDVQDKIGDFMQTGGGELKDFFEKIAPQVGVTADSFKNLSGPDALQLFYNSLEKANLSQKETVFWMEAIADDATNLIPLLQQNGAGFEAAADRAQKYGAVLSDYALAASKEFKSQTDEMALAIEGASNILAVGLMPVVSETIDSLLAYSAESGAAEVATNAVKAVLETLIVVASEVAFVFKGVGTEIGGIAAQAGAFLSLDFSRVKAIREMMKEDASAAKAELDAFQQRVLNADKAAKAAFAVTDAVKKAKFGTEEYVTAVNGLIKAQASGQITTAQMNATLRSVSPAAASAGKSLSGMGIGAEKAKKASEDAAKAASQYAKDLSATYAELNGVSNDYYGQIEKYQAQLKKRDITEAQYIELMEKLIQKQPFAVALTKSQTEAFKEQEDARKKAYDANEKAYQSEVDAAQKSAKAAQEKVGQLSDEAQAIEISKEKHITLAEAMEEVIVKRLEDQLESAKQADNQELLDAIADEIKARKELGKALGDREVREAADDAAQDAAKSWKATADKINNDLTDAIIAGFEGGKNGAQALKDSLVKMFNDMVLRPVISAIVAPVSGMLATGAQAATSAIGGSGFGGSMVSGLAGNVLGSLGAFGGAVQGFGTAALAATQSMIGMTGTVAQMSTSLAAAGHTAAAGMQSGISAFQAIPGWGWALAGIGLLAGMMDFGGEQRFGGGYQLNGNKEVKYTAGPGGGQINQEAQEAVVNETYKSVNSILKSLGSTLEVIDFYAGLETSGKGKGGTFAGGKLSSGVEFGKKWQAGMYSQDLSAEEAVKQFAEQMKIVTVEALKAATDIPQYLQAELAKVDVTKLTGETAGLVLEEVNRMFTTFSTVKAAFEILNKPMFDTTTAGYELTESFVNLFGGLENFKSATASYYENFYSESERFNNAQQQLTQTLTEAGLAVPTTREAYRQLVEAQDLTTEAGRKNYAVLLKNAGAFAELTPAASEANKQIAGINKLFHGLSIDGKLVETKFTKATEEIFDSLGVSVQEYSSSIGGVISGILTGTTKAEDAGAALANAAVGGINNAIAQAASDAIAAQFVNAVITPILANIQSGRAALEGVDVKGAIAKANQDALDVKTVLNTIGVELGSGIEGMAAALVNGAQTAGVQIANASKFAGVQTPGYVPGTTPYVPGTTPGETPTTITPSLFAGVQGGGGLTLEPAVSAVSSLVTETLESNKKVSELLQKLLNPKKEYANRYLELDDRMQEKRKERRQEDTESIITSLENKIEKQRKIMSIADNVLAYNGLSGASITDQKLMQGIIDDITELVNEGLLPVGTDIHQFAQNIIELPGALESTGSIDKLQGYLNLYLGLGNNFLGTDINTLISDLAGEKNNLAILEKELRDWYIAQARVIAVEDYATNLEESAAAKSKTAELKRTGGLEDPVTKLKEQFAAKMQAIDDGIGKALMEEVDKLKAQKPDDKVLNPLKLNLQQAKSWLETYQGDTTNYQALLQQYIDEDILALQTTDMGSADILVAVQQRIRDNQALLNSLKDGSIITKTQEEITTIEQQITDAVIAATDPAKQQELLDEIATYKGGITEWFEAQAELLSTEMLVDINKQITALEAEEKGPLTTIKDAIQKYADDFEALGTMTDDVQAQLDKLAGLQLEKARNALYDQLLTPEEVTANAKAKLKTDFGDIISTALGETMMGSIESQMMGGGVPQGSEALITLLQGVGEEMPTTTAGFRALIDSIDTSTTSGQNLRDSLLELVPGFVSLQGAADGATDALTPLEEVEKAFGALERAINAEKEALRTAFDARMEVLQKELAIAQERAGIENQAIKLLGRSKELRAAELEAMDASNRGLKQRIWAVEDASENVDKALSTLQRSVASQKASVSESAQAQIDAINAGAEARQKVVDDAQKSVQDLTGIFDEITNAIKTLRGNAQDEAMRMEQARAYISMALSVAQAGGAVDQKRLSEAMATVTSDTADTYAAGADYRFAQARQAAELQKLADVTGGQKDVAQATLDAALAANQTAQDQIKAITEARDSQLKALDNQLKTAQDAVSVMRGVDLSVLGVGDAVTALDTAMAAYEVERARLGAEQLFTGQIQVTLLEKQIEQEQANFDAQIDALDSQLEIAQSQLDALRGVDNSVKGLAAAMSAFAAAQAAAAAAAKAAAATPASGGAITYDGQQGPGLYVNGGLTGGVRPKPVPSYDVGTNYVPRDTLAMVHEGEAIVPKAFNPAVFGGAKSDDGQLASLVVSLTTEVQRLQGIVQAGNAEQRRTADAVNGRPEAPMLVETV